MPRSWVARTSDADWQTGEATTKSCKGVRGRERKKGREAERKRTEHPEKSLGADETRAHQSMDDVTGPHHPSRSPPPSSNRVVIQNRCLAAMHQRNLVVRISNCVQVRRLKTSGISIANHACKGSSRPAMEAKSASERENLEILDPQTTPRRVLVSWKGKKSVVFV